jgi:hypothetical protein
VPWHNVKSDNESALLPFLIQPQPSTNNSQSTNNRRKDKINPIDKALTLNDTDISPRTQSAEQLPPIEETSDTSL